MQTLKKQQKAKRIATFVTLFKKNYVYLTANVIEEVLCLTNKVQLTCLTNEKNLLNTVHTHAFFIMDFLVLSCTLNNSIFAARMYIQLIQRVTLMDEYMQYYCIAQNEKISNKKIATIIKNGNLAVVVLQSANIICKKHNTYFAVYNATNKAQKIALQYYFKYC